MMKNVRRVDNPVSEGKPAMKRSKQRRKAEPPPRVIYRPYHQKPNRIIRDRTGKMVRIFPRRSYRPNGEREVARRKRQIAAGQLTVSNGLVL